MRVIDISGVVHSGMWSYGEPFPEYRCKPVPQPDWLEYPIYSEIFEGMNSQTGTYLETPAHLLGYEDSYEINAVPLERLIDVKAYVIQLDLDVLPKVDGRRAITLRALESAATERDLSGCAAIIVSTGWGSRWRDEGFVTESPFFKLEAMRWIVDHKPSILCTDSPRWENLDHPEGFFPLFFNADILMLTPCVNLEAISSAVVRLTALPLRIENTCCTPCRAYVVD